jgi:hypothetical protein
MLCLSYCLLTLLQPIFMAIVGDLFPGEQSALLQQHTELRRALTALIGESQISDKQPLQAVPEQVCAYSCYIANEQTTFIFLECCIMFAERLLLAVLEQLERLTEAYMVASVSMQLCGDSQCCAHQCRLHSLYH